MASTTTTSPFESRYPELILPEHGFQSTIPPHLLEGADDQMRWLMNEVSRNSAATEFACKGAVDVSRHLRALNGKTYKNEKGLEETRDDILGLKHKAKAVEPFIKPISMFANLWEYTVFKWFFIGGIVFFIGVLYPYFLKMGLLDLLDSYFKGH